MSARCSATISTKICDGRAENERPFPGAFAEERGKWLARLVIAVIAAAMSGYLALPR